MSDTAVTPQPSPQHSPYLPSQNGSSMRGRRAGLAAVALMVGSVALAWAVARWAYPLPVPRSDRPTRFVPTVRLFAGSEEIAAFQGDARYAQIWVPLPEIPRHVVNAVLAAEDRRFFQHPGIDAPAVLRAALRNLRHQGVRQGGSTITQQLARTLYYTNERTWGRKLRESGAALLLELHSPKDRILEAYLNTVYMGHDRDIAIHGVAAAARHFLGKDLAQVRLDEAALLAATIHAPNRTFLGHFSRITRARRDRILGDMQDMRMADASAVGEALAQALPRRQAGSMPQGSYFVDVAREEVSRRVALTGSGEVRVATTLDPVLQRAAERSLREGLDRIERSRPGIEGGRLQGALVAIEPASGAVRALVGGRRYRESPFNRAAHAARQPGSLFKPFVYLAAFEAERTGQGALLTPASLIPDDPLTILAGTATWTPHNYDHQFRGPVTVRRALEASLNVPAVRVAQEVGLRQVTQVAQALGITRPLAQVPSVALGTSEVTLLEITAAYATLANGGVRAVPTMLAEGVPQGAAALEPLPPPTRVVSAESAFLITHMLRGVMRRGTARASARWGLNEVAAGKTGTTDGLRDAWFVGYTPDLTVGVWVGMDDDTPIGLTGAQGALPIWAGLMKAAVRRAPPRPFSPPAGIVMALVDSVSGRLASVACGGGPPIQEAFRAGSEPREAECVEPPARDIRDTEEAVADRVHAVDRESPQGSWWRTPAAVEPGQRRVSEPGLSRHGEVCAVRQEDCPGHEGSG